MKSFLGQDTSALQNQLTREVGGVCRVFGRDAVEGSTQGTGFAVAGGQFVVTAAHVVPGSDLAIVGSRGAPPWTCQAAVVARSIEHDLAVLRLDAAAPIFFRLAAHPLDDAVGPLICWEDRGSEEWDVANALTLVPIPALLVGSIDLKSSGNRRRLAIAGRFRAGMSGGPVYSPLLDVVIGVVCEMPRYDPYQVVEAAAESTNLGIDLETLVLAQLQAGLGIAIPADLAQKLIPV